MIKEQETERKFIKKLGELKYIYRHLPLFREGV